MSENNNIYKNCKNWNKSPFSKENLGVCNISRNRNDIMYSGCGLKTNENFGCILFNDNNTKQKLSYDQINYDERS